MSILTTKKFSNSFVFIANCSKQLALLLFVCFVSTFLRAQEGSLQENDQRATFLYNFTHFVDWPTSALGASETPFIIGILGSDPFGKTIDETVAGETLKGHPLLIKRYQDVKEIKDCQVLFISTNEPEHIKALLDSLPAGNILTVSDTYNFARVGGMIRLYMQDNKIKLQINQTAAKTANLDISSKLLKLADIIN